MSDFQKRQIEMFTLQLLDVKLCKAELTAVFEEYIDGAVVKKRLERVLQELSAIELVISDQLVMAGGKVESKAA